MTLDGFDAGGYRWKKERVISSCYVSNTTARDFSFSAITFTGWSFYHIYPHTHSLSHYICHSDNDAYLNTPVAHLGEIKIEVWAYNMIIKETTARRIDPITSSNVKVHERSKEVGAHRVQYVFGRFMESRQYGFF